MSVWEARFYVWWGATGGLLIGAGLLALAGWWAVPVVAVAAFAMTVVAGLKAAMG